VLGRDDCFDQFNGETTPLQRRSKFDTSTGEYLVSTILGCVATSEDRFDDLFVVPSRFFAEMIFHQMSKWRRPYVMQENCRSKRATFLPRVRLECISGGKKQHPQCMRITP
jgi:hypothetical protein